MLKAFDALKAAPLIVNGAARLGERDATDARRTHQTAGLVLDIHDANFHKMCALPPNVTDHSPRAHGNRFGRKTSSRD